MTVTAKMKRGARVVRASERTKVERALSYFLRTPRAVTHTDVGGQIVREYIMTERRAVRRFRIKTADLRRLPDFMIIGAAKSGTTTLFKWLAEHPDTTPAFEKEPNFFAHNYGRGESWYRAHFPLVGRNRFEASAAYLWDSDAPVRVRAACPDALFIAVLRDPVERAYSDYLFNKRGWPDENLPFLDAVLNEPERVSIDPHRFSYIDRGRYVDQIRRWHHVFGREQLLVVSAEDMRTDPPRVYRTCCRFLGLREYEPNYYAHNVRPSTERMPDEARAYLTEYFTPLNAELFDYLGRSFQWQMNPTVYKSCTSRRHTKHPTRSVPDD